MVNLIKGVVGRQDLFEASWLLAIRLGGAGLLLGFR
jgi:hypothetical protein